MELHELPSNKSVRIQEEIKVESFPVHPIGKSTTKGECVQDNEIYEEEDNPEEVSETSRSDSDEYEVVVVEQPKTGKKKT